MISYEKGVARMYKETVHGTFRLRENIQGRTNLEEVKTSLQKVWFSPLASREIGWMGQAGAGPGLLGQQEATLCGTGG